MDVATTPWCALLTGLSMTEALLALRAKHNAGFTIGLTIGAVFLAKHLNLYDNHFRAVPASVLYILGGWMVVLLYIRLRTFQPTKGMYTYCTSHLFCNL